VVKHEQNHNSLLSHYSSTKIGGGEGRRLFQIIAEEGAKIRRRRLFEDLRYITSGTLTCPIITSVLLQYFPCRTYLQGYQPGQNMGTD